MSPRAIPAGVGNASETGEVGEVLDAAGPSCRREELAARLALLALPGVGPARARWLLSAASAADVLGHLRAGRLPPELGPAPPGVTPNLVRRWTSGVRQVAVDELLAETERQGIEIVDPGHDRWPFAADPEPPVVLFCQGRSDLLGRRPAVAIVGTRRCTAVGRQVAARFGAGLAEAGVIVVSGLASGIDGAAHEGVLAAGGDAVGVVGTGLDVVYPKRNRRLWEEVGSAGLLVSESVLGAKAERWRFPARNRLIAGLADAVLVVESHQEGGSLLTVGEAADRGCPVLAVPGSVTSPASAGSNQLLVEGCQPACSVDDVLDAIGVVRPLVAVSPPAETRRVERPDDLSPLAAWVLDQVDGGAVHVDGLAVACREPITRLLAEVEQLEARGLVAVDGSTVSPRGAP